MTNEKETSPKLDKNALANIVSPSMDEVISKNPGFIVNRGITIIFIFVLLLIASTFFINYPDSIYCIARLTTNNSSRPIIVNQSGTIGKISVQNGQHVEKNDVIAYLEDSVNINEVLQLEKVAIYIHESINIGHNTENLNAHLFSTIKSGHLGNFQNKYQTFLQSYIGFLANTNQGYFVKKLALLNNELSFLEADQKKMSGSPEAPKSINNKDVDNTNSNTLASIELNKALSTNVIMQNEKKREILETENLISTQKLIFNETVNNFLNEIKEWKDDFILMAPTSGKIDLASFLQDNKQVSSSQTIGHIIPENDQYYMQIKIPQYNFGKVQTGQQVLLNFYSYPWREYGSIIGELEYVSIVPTDTSGYMAKIKLINGLTTTYKKNIPFTEGLMAEARIITENKSLFDVLVTKVLKNK